MVESLSLAREVLVRYLPPPWCVLYEQRQIYSLKIPVYTQESVALSRPIEDLLTGTLSLESLYTSEQKIYIHMEKKVREHLLCYEVKLWTKYFLQFKYLLTKLFNLSKSVVSNVAST